jgi:hypothetical protein
VKFFLAIGILIVFAGCGSGANATGGESTNPALAGRRIIVEQPGESQALPRVQVPQGSPPKRLVIHDLKDGTGPGVKPTDAIVIAYEGVAYKTGRRFDARPRSEPFFFQTGRGEIMPGLEQVVIGMKVGGRREAVIPPRLTLNEIGKPETLVYVVDLLLDESADEYDYRQRHGISMPLPSTIDEAQQGQ